MFFIDFFLIFPLVQESFPSWPENKREAKGMFPPLLCSFKKQLFGGCFYFFPEESDLF